MDKLTSGPFNPFFAYNFYSEEGFSFPSLKINKIRRKKNILIFVNKS